MDGGRRWDRPAREGRHPRQVRASRAGRDEWGRDKSAGRERAWNCALAYPAGELVALAREPGESAAVAIAPPCRGAEVLSDARPVVRRGSGVAAAARACPASGWPMERKLRRQAVHFGPPAGTESSPTTAAWMPRDWEPAWAAADLTKSGPGVAWEPDEPEPDPCATGDAAEQRRQRITEAAVERACCAAVLLLNFLG